MTVRREFKGKGMLAVVWHLQRSTCNIRVAKRFPGRPSCTLPPAIHNHVKGLSTPSLLMEYIKYISYRSASVKWASSYRSMLPVCASRNAPR
jgi:hypothetical protein